MPTKKRDTRSVSPQDKILGGKIRTYRALAGISQSDLGAALDPPVSFQQIQKYEKGNNRVSYTKLLQICNALGVNPVDMTAEMKGDGQTSKQSTEMISLIGDRFTYRLVKAFREMPRETQAKLVQLAESIVHVEAA